MSFCSYRKAPKPELGYRNAVSFSIAQTQNFTLSTSFSEQFQKQNLLGKAIHPQLVSIQTLTAPWAGIKSTDS